MIGGLKLACGAILLATFISGNGKADVVYSNFGPGGTYDCCGAHGIGYFLTIRGASDQQIGMAFTPTSDFYLSQIDLPITWGGGSNDFIVTLQSDSSGLPGAVLESWELAADLPPLGHANPGAETLLASSAVTLQADQQYWLVVAGGTDTTSGAWNFSSTDALGLEAIRLNGGSFTVDSATWFNPMSAFDVLGTPVGAVPEPSSALLVGAVILGLVTCRRRFPLRRQ
jgi:PEP-CTERM motif-containing protein